MAEMRVGIFLNNYRPSVGGGYTFQASIVDAVKTGQYPHSFVIFQYGQAKEEANLSIPLIDLRKRYLENEPGSIRLLLKKIHGRIRSRRFANATTNLVRLIRRVATLLQTDIPEQVTLLDQAVRDNQIDIVWFPTPAYEKVTVPFIYTVWDLQHRVQPFFPEVSVTGWKWDSREQTYTSILPRAMKVLTGTTVGKKEIIQFYGVHPRNVEVIPFPVPSFACGDTADNEDDIRKKYNLTRDYLLYPAQFWPHKNHINILFALEHLKKDYSIHLNMVFVGSDMGNEAYVRKTTDALGLSTDVHFLGFVPGGDLVRLYQNAFALLFGSFFGPDNLPPLEAFALGCPVIASRVAGAEEQLGDAALLFDPRSVDEMVAMIRTLYQDPALRQTLVRKGLDRVRGRSPQDYVNSVSRILDEFESVKRCWSSNYRHS